MKQTHFKSWFTLMIGCLFFMNVQPLLASGEGEGEDKKKEIPLQGHCGEEIRSLSIEIPISVFWDGTNLYIESNSSRSDIQVVLLDEMGSIYEVMLPAGICPATLYVGCLTPGKTYRLVLTNQYGARLEGEIF